MSAMQHAQCDAGLLDQIDRLIGFNRHVTHDLRGPLVSIVGVSELAQKAIARGEMETAEHLLGRLGERASGLLRLIQQLHCLVQADGPLVGTTLELTSLAKGAIEEARASVQVNTKAQVDLRPLPRCWGVDVLLRQVYVNLISNALKFSSSSVAPLIEIGATTVNGQQALYVRDNGIGFRESDIQCLFLPFSRLHGNSYAGDGIGLSFVKQVVERHGGCVWAVTRKRGGATFFFTLKGLSGGASVGGARCVDVPVRTDHVAA